MTLHWPLKDHARITQHFGEHPEVYAQFGMKGHNGLDFDAVEGTQILAATDGLAIFLKDLNANGTFKGYGNYVQLNAPDGSQTYYAHMLRFEGATRNVRAGDVIGYVDSTGFSSGDHLHFTYKPAHADYNNGFSGAVDPLPFLTDEPMKLVNDNGTYFLVGEKGKIGIADLDALAAFKAITASESTGTTAGVPQVKVIKKALVME